VKNRIVSILLAAVLILSVGVIGCGGEQIREYSLTISSTEGGEMVTPGQGTFIYDEGTVVPLGLVMWIPLPMSTLLRPPSR
jgi:hypothetical protein